MHIDLASINRDDFFVDKRNHDIAGEVYLITPGFKKNKWTPEDLHLRSLLCRANGEIISSGFAKFYNYGQDHLGDAITDERIRSGNAVYSEKMDGSLIIRSIIDGRVCFRTRGSHHLGSFEEPVMELVNSKYPNLNNPEYCPGTSLLFEYTSPDNKIVVSYTESKLTVLGMMTLHLDKLPQFYSSSAIVAKLEALFGTPAVRFFDLPKNTEELIAVISDWKNAEGIVVWSKLDDGTMHLSKIKADDYIRIHSLKYHLSNDKVRLFCFCKGITTQAQLENAFNEIGVDWEFVSFIQPIFEQYLEKKNKIDKMVAEFIDGLENEGVPRFATRKEIALRLKEITAKTPELFNIGIQYCIGNKNYVNSCRDALILDVSVKNIENVIKETDQLIIDLNSKNVIDME